MGMRRGWWISVNRRMRRLKSMLLNVALNVVGPVAVFCCIIEHESRSARDFKTLDTSTNKILSAGIGISIEATDLPVTIKAVSRSDVMSSFYGWGCSFIKQGCEKCYH